MISYRILFLNLVILFVGLPIIAFLYLAPFHFFVDIEYVHHQDTCAGQNLQTIVTLRDVKWRDEYHAAAFEQLFRYDGDEKIETIFKREINFVYQKADNPITLEIDWNQSLPAGEYGVYTSTEIDTGFKKREIRSEDTQRFSVVECTGTEDYKI